MNQSPSQIIAAISARKKSPQNLTAQTLLGGLSSVYDKFANPENEYCKKVELYDSKEDVLALSCAWQRYRMITDPKLLTVTIDNIRSSDLYEMVRDEDKQKAADIRDYYQKRIMLWKLSGKTLSKFRTDLERFVQETGYRYLDSDTGMAYKLPEFYDYDVVVDALKDKYVDTTETLLRQNSGFVTLQPITILNRKLRGLNNNVYWFKLHGRNTLAQYTLLKSNPLRSFFESIFNNSMQLELNCSLNITDREGFRCFFIDKITDYRFDK